MQECYCDSCAVIKETPRKCPKNIYKGFQDLGRTALPEGHILNGAYQINGVIGHGGFGITYSACSRLKPVAIKEPLLALQDVDDVKEEQDRFIDEARRMIKINHPNVVKIENVIKDADSVYLIMEYLEGENLLSYVQREGLLSETTAMNIIRPVLDALETIHSAGLIHRDIKPSNIMLCTDGTVKLIDFGCARSVNATTKTAYISAGGYTPIEQYDEYGNQGVWTDIYALCATIYRIVSRSAIPEAQARVFADTLQCPTGVSAEFADVLMKGLAVQPEDRWQSVAELREALIDTVTDPETEAAEAKEQRIQPTYVYEDESWERKTELINRNESWERKTEHIPVKDWAYTSEDVQKSLKKGQTVFIVPDGVTSIGDKAFSGCASLTEIRLPDGVSSIGDEAFDGCASLTEIRLPDGVTNIGNWAFYGCASLTKIRLPDGVTSISNWVFGGCASLTEIRLPNGVTSIGRWAFLGCTVLTKIRLPDGVSSIGKGAFWCCASLTKIHLPGSIISIGEHAFSYVTGTVYYPKSCANFDWVGKNYGGKLTWVMEEPEKNSKNWSRWRGWIDKWFD